MIEFTPHEYQKRGYDFIQNTPQCMLAFDMGLGKTVTTLYALNELINDFAVNKVLVIAPLYVAKDTWPREVKKWSFAQNLRMSVICGSAEEREAALKAEADIYVINRENTKWLVYTLGEKWPFDCVVIDESSSFKSHSSERFRALKLVVREGLIKRLILLTGTPRPRSIEDLWSQMFLIDQGQRMGKTLTAFRTKYEMPGRRNGHIIYDWKITPEAEEEVYQKLGDVIMSMRAEDWLEVPPVTYIDHNLSFDDKTAKKYKKFTKEKVLELEDETIAATSAGTLVGKLLQFTSGAIYTDITTHEYEVVHDVKLEATVEIVESTEEPVMIFYYFKSDYIRLQNALRKYNPRTIQSPKDIEDWNAGKIRVLLAQPQSMGHGLNLQEGPGRTIIWFTPIWDLEITQQAEARLHRQGQKRAVQIHRLIMNGTVDCDVIKALDKKETGQNALLEFVNAKRKEVHDEI